MSSSVKIVLFKAENDQEKDDYLELFKRNEFEAYTVSPIKFEFKNLNVLASKLENSNFCLNYSSLVITSPRVIQILKYLLQNQQLTLNSLRQIRCFTVGPQTQKKLFNEFQINSLVDNERLNINNAKELAKYLIEHEKQLSEQIDLSKPLLYPTSDLSRNEFGAYLEKSEFKVEKLICYETLPNEQLDQELRNIFERSIANDNKTDNTKPENKELNELVDKSFIFVFFSPSGVTSVMKKVKCVKFEKVKLIAIGPTTKIAIEENKLNLVSISAKPTPEALLETIVNYSKTQFTD